MEKQIMSPTHILIPIADIEKSISTFENLIKIETKAKNEDWELLVQETEELIKFYKALYLRKQISLDKKDIDLSKMKQIGEECFLKLRELNPSGGIKEFVRIASEFGYKQALKDLL